MNEDRDDAGTVGSRQDASKDARAVDDESDAGPANTDSGVRATQTDSGPMQMTGGNDAGTSDAGMPPVAGDPLAPWKLDCAHLPTNGTCQGGPREVLLVTTQTGLVFMFDEQDGHYINYFKPPSQMSGDRETGYIHFTQGPDQCVWSTTGDDNDETKRAVQRWNTDGSFHDDIIPRGKFKRGTVDRLRKLRTLAFTADKVYVTTGEHVSTFSLSGEFGEEVVADSSLRSSIVLGDGSVITGGPAMKRWPVDKGPAKNVLTEMVEQVAYGTKGNLLGVSWNEGQIYTVSADTGATDQITVETGSVLTQGVGLLGNGRYAYSGGESNRVVTVDPTNGDEKVDQLKDWKDLRLGDFGNPAYIGRACLPIAVVERMEQPDPEISADKCDDIPAGAAIVDEGFETGAFTGSGANRSFNGWEETTGYMPRSEIDETEHAVGARSLRVSPKEEQNYASGVAHEFANIKPSYIGYRVKYDAQDDGWAKFAIRDKYEFETGTVSLNGFVTDNTNFVADVEPNTWVRVQYRDINWDKLTYDLYVDCERLGDNIPMNPDGGDGLSRIDLYVRANGGAPNPAWFDDIVIK